MLQLIKINEKKKRIEGNFLNVIKDMFQLSTTAPGFNPWAGKISWRRERLPTLAFWPGEFCGLYSPCSRKELDMTE